MKDNNQLIQSNTNLLEQSLIIIIGMVTKLSSSLIILRLKINLKD